jgi:RNA polymerase sigma factor for flagellar operon FliA
VSATLQPIDLSAQPELERELWRRWRSERDERAREQLIGHYLPYARVVAASYYRRRTHNEIEFAEYLQLASVGMVESLDRYDPALGAQFKTFAARRMHGAILNGLERLTEKQQQIAVRQRLRHERLQAIKAEAEGARQSVSGAPNGRHAPHAETLFRYLAEIGIGLALSHLLEGTGMVEGDRPACIEGDRHYQNIELKQLRSNVRALVDQLSGQERTVIHYHYLQEHEFDEIAQMLGVTRGRVSQIHRKALTRLRDQLGAQRRCDVAW